MQNTPIGNKTTPAKSLHNVSETLRDSSEQVVSDLGAKASKLTTEATEAANEYYGKTNTWLQQNYGKTLGAIGFIAAVGTIGYMLGRNNGRSQSDTLISQRS